MNIAAEGELPLRPLLGEPEDDRDTLDQLDVLRADRYYGEYSGYGKRYYSKKYSYGYTAKKS